MSDHTDSGNPAVERRKFVNIGPSIFVRGELTGSEDMTIEGRVEGKIDLSDRHLTIGPQGRVKAEVRAKSVTVHGEVTGNLIASERVELAPTGRVVGDIIAPRIAIADGARLKGSVEMTGTPAEAPRKEAGKPHAASAPPPAAMPATPPRAAVS